MNIAPPTPAEIDHTIAAAERNLRQRIGRRRTISRVGIGTGALLILGIAGTGAATAFFPQYFDLQGVVKTAYSEQFIDCVKAAGWDARALPAAEGALVIESWGLDPSTHTVVTSHLAQQTQGEAGRAISACQEKISDKVGEQIMGVVE